MIRTTRATISLPMGCKHSALHCPEGSFPWRPEASAHSECGAAKMAGLWVRKQLAGRTVAVPETRELEVFAAMPSAWRERRAAARWWRSTRPDPAPVLAFARGFAAPLR